MKITVLHPFHSNLAEAFKEFNSKQSDFKTIVFEGHLTDDQLRHVCYFGSSILLDPIGCELKHKDMAFWWFERTHTDDPKIFHL